jgi:uncharacterized protein
MPSYLSPGVFVEEVDTGARPIEAVGTSVAGFLGAAPVADAHVDEAFAINNWAQFKNEFVRDSKKSTHLTNAVYAYFANGGTRCYVVNTKSPTATRKSLDPLSRIDEIAMIAAPGMTDVGSYSALLDAAESMKDRIAILDAPSAAQDVEALTRVAVEAGAAPADPKARPAGLRPRNSDGGFGAFYFPWLRAYDAVADDTIVSVPPSGFMAGIYARTDTDRGVHKAPANVAVYGAIGVTQQISRSEHDVLNPAGVNCIRFFTREGVRVWGARTLAPSASNWRYINVRRLFSMVEKSIGRSTRWVVFEPNNTTLWKSIQRDIVQFLTLLYRQGALQGASPREAFFVKCDEETNPPESIKEGQVVILIGMAPVMPAEFVIFRIGQSDVGTTLETV